MAEVFLHGLLLRAIGCPITNLSASFELVRGDGWTIEAGAESGQSQFDSPECPEFEGHIFQLPFEIHLKTTTLSSWPILSVKLSTLAKGLKQLVAQTDFHVPFASGHHMLKNPAWAVSRQIVQREGGLGRAQPGGSVISDGDRAALLTESCGEVELELWVSSSGLAERGVMV